MTSSIPLSQSTVKVYIISPNRVLGVPPAAFLTPVIKGTTYSDTPCLCFLVKHTDATGRTSRALFDLGIRQDLENSPPIVVNAIKSMNIEIDTPHDVAHLLEANDISLSSIDTIFLSHWHFDHFGDPTRFPSTARIVVGPGFKEACLPGYPTDSESMIPEAAFEGRQLGEADFERTDLRIADLEALDWFGDGSFYLLSSPGHAVGHLSALARTTAATASSDSTFMLLAGDVCHHAGELRPTERQQLPTDLSLSDAAHTYKARSEYHDIHPHRCLSRPFYCPSAGGFNLDAETMRRTVDKVSVLDAEPNVFVVLAHDHWLLNQVELFPEPANEWRAKGWKDSTKWRFLLDFA